jgi:hypothetical protein
MRLLNILVYTLIKGQKFCLLRDFGFLDLNIKGVNTKLCNIFLKKYIQGGWWKIFVLKGIYKGGGVEDVVDLKIYPNYVLPTPHHIWIPTYVVPYTTLYIPYIYGTRVYQPTFTFHTIPCLISLNLLNQIFYN